MIVRRLVAAATLLIAGCTAGPDYRVPPALTGSAPPPPLIEAANPAYDINPPPDGWWRLYGNPVLDGLIDKALRHNPDLRSSLATLEQAQAQLRAAERQRTPSTNLSVSPGYSQVPADLFGLPIEPSPSFLFTASEMFSYDFDVAGRLRRSVEAARAQVGAQAAALDYARTTIAAATAGAYSSVCSTGLQINVTNESIALTRADLDVVRRFFTAGIVGANDVVRSRTQLEQTEATLPGLVAQNRAALYMLVTLTGDPPETLPAGVAGCVVPPVLRFALPVGDGTQMLARRADVRQSERMLAASVAQIGVSTADLYPSITLGATVGELATSVPDIVKYRAFRFNVGPMLSWTFPNRSIARARIAVANAAARGALAQFDSTVLTALRQTETALATLAHRLDTERALTLARDDAALSYRNVNRLYRGGISPFIDALDAERTLIQAQNALAQATAQVSQDQINLFQALGGGWQQAPKVQDTPLDRVEKPKQ